MYRLLRTNLPPLGGGWHTVVLWSGSLQDDFDKIEDSIDFAYKRFPDLERRGREKRDPRAVYLCP